MPRTVMITVSADSSPPETYSTASLAQLGARGNKQTARTAAASRPAYSVAYGDDGRSAVQK